MGYSDDRRRRLANHCHLCGKPIYLSGKNAVSSGWVSGDVFGVARLIQVHHECHFKALDEIREGKTA